MQIEFYIDVWLIANAGVNYVLLDIAGLWWNWEKSHARYLLASLVGAAMSVLVLGLFWCLSKNQMLPAGLKVLLLFGAFVGIPYVMLALALKGSHDGQGRYRLLGLWGTAFLMGGCLLFVRELFCEPGTKAYVITIVGMDLFAHGIAVPLRKWREHNRLLRWAVVYGMRDAVRVRAFYDSGNSLCEPYTGKPVVLVSPAVLQRLKGQLGKGVLIPYYSLGNDAGMIPAYRCKGLDVWSGRPAQKRHYDAVMLAADARIFSHRQEYDLILHHSMD